MVFKCVFRNVHRPFSQSEPNKRQRVSQVTGPVRSMEEVVATQRTKNPLLGEIEQRSINAILKRKENQATVAKSVQARKTVWGNELTLEIAVQMVDDVRADVAANIHACSVCYLIAGERNVAHKSGTSCSKMPLGPNTDGWESFKKDLKFVENIMCWNCLFPTVRDLLDGSSDGR